MTDYQDGTPHANPAGNIILILANLPEFMRKPMLQRRLGEFYLMDNELRSETIRMALDAAPSVEPGKLAILLKTWLELLADFDPEKRSIMFHAYCKEILKMDPSKVEKLDLAMIANVFSSISESKRQILTDAIHEVLLSVPHRARLIKLAPDYLLSALRLR